MIDREFIEKIEDMTGPKVIVTPQGAFRTRTYIGLKINLLIQ